MLHTVQYCVIADEVFKLNDHFIVIRIKDRIFKKLVYPLPPKKKKKNSELFCLFVLFSKKRPVGDGGAAWGNVGLLGQAASLAGGSKDQGCTLWFLFPRGQKRRCWAYNLVLAQSQVSVRQYFCFEHICPYFPFSLLAHWKEKNHQR